MKLRALLCLFYPKKLKSLKLALNDLNRENYSDLENRVKESHNHLIACQETLLMNPSPRLASLERETHKKWLVLADAEEIFFKQRSRVNWIDAGDSNTSFFHKMVAERNSINQIHYLIDCDGSRLESLLEIQSHVVNYYKDLLGSNLQPLFSCEADLITCSTSFSCSDTVRAALINEVSSEDIKREVFALPANKSLGPDSYTGEFFRSTWDIVGEDVTAAVKEFFKSGKILRQCNATAVTLIPKKTAAEKLSDFRPISLCNAVYKVISKILSRKLQLIMHEIISNSQSAFIKGRLLAENVLLATELVQGFNRKGISPRGMLKVDLKKAFDCVRWDFIQQVLRAANFPSIFINWISQCLTTTSLSININGNLCGYFNGKRGLRQGDPLSPYLFVMSMQIFSTILESQFDLGRIGCHPLADHPRISHLCFADDVMIFFDGSLQSIKGITSALTSFQVISGLAMNRDKTELFLAGVDPGEAMDIYLMGFQNGSFPIRYLGLPLMHSKLKKSAFSPLLDKVEARFKHWATKTLSFAGRLQLISATIYRLINFWMAAFSLPKGCLKIIEQLCGRFLWSGDTLKHGGRKVSWKQVCLPKDEGGLGLRNFTILNTMLNLRLIWLLLTSTDSLWATWIREKRLNNTNFWVVNPTQFASWIWRLLLSLRPMARRFLKCTLGNGTRASFWFDSWLSCDLFYDLLGET